MIKINQIGCLARRVNDYQAEVMGQIPGLVLDINNAIPLSIYSRLTLQFTLLKKIY